ncbi:hypothetical protein Rhe02_51610 [Rhizocola hellebori]|uniref:CBM2 domain-containing protein n=1 Tax=Rhizocola hellebori TaxID=1392758 RepID=A0A8J3QAD7_9ACTN|nr:hypothetical protein [Rhizocola hellebori]GIH07094.1 hypothetical protein Rhe02_51610 [Rhizocola hellebori]
MRWPRLNLPTDRRVRLISVIGSAVLVVLIATTAAVLLNSGPAASPQDFTYDDRLGLQTAAQSGPPGSSPGTQPRPTTSPTTPAASPLAGAGPSAPAGGTLASYKTIALLGLGGFDTEVTVTNPGEANWQLVLTMPADRVVENRSTDQVKMTQNGTTVTLTPVRVADKTVVFTVRFPALLALGKSVTACTIDGRACSAS